MERTRAHGTGVDLAHVAQPGHGPRAPPRRRPWRAWVQAYKQVVSERARPAIARRAAAATCRRSEAPWAPPTASASTRWPSPGATRAAGRHMALTIFTPAMKRLDATITATRAGRARRGRTAARPDRRRRLAPVRRAAPGAAGLAAAPHPRRVAAWPSRRAPSSAAARSACMRSCATPPTSWRSSTPPRGCAGWPSRSAACSATSPSAGRAPPGRAACTPTMPTAWRRSCRTRSSRRATRRLLSVRLRDAEGGYRHLELVADNRLSDPLIDGILSTCATSPSASRCSSSCATRPSTTASPACPTARCSRIA